MYFHNKLIWGHKYEYYLLETWSNMNHLKWHATHSQARPWGRARGAAALGPRAVRAPNPVCIRCRCVPCRSSILEFS